MLTLIYLWRDANYQLFKLREALSLFKYASFAIIALQVTSATLSTLFFARLPILMLPTIYDAFRYRISFIRCSFF